MDSGTPSFSSSSWASGDRGWGRLSRLPAPSPRQCSSWGAGNERWAYARGARCVNIAAGHILVSDGVSAELFCVGPLSSGIMVLLSWINLDFSFDRHQPLWLQGHAPPRAGRSRRICHRQGCRWKHARLHLYWIFFDFSKFLSWILNVYKEICSCNLFTCKEKLCYSWCNYHSFMLNTHTHAHTLMTEPMLFSTSNKSAGCLNTCNTRTSLTHCYIWYITHGIKAAPVIKYVLKYNKHMWLSSIKICYPGGDRFQTVFCSVCAKCKWFTRVQYLCVCAWYYYDYVTTSLPGLSGTLSASVDLPEVPAAGSAVLLAVPGVINVLRAPKSLTQNYKTNTHTHASVHHLSKCVRVFTNCMLL